MVSYLSEADCLLTGSPIASYNSENTAELIAASVAARGVLFGNAHVAPSRYLDCHTILYGRAKGFFFTMICTKQVAYHPEPEALAD